MDGFGGGGGGKVSEGTSDFRIQGRRGRSLLVIKGDTWVMGRSRFQ